MPFRQLGPEDAPPIDPLVQALTAEQVRGDIAIYESLLDSGASELPVHDFLANHSYFFNRIVRLNGASPLYSKVRLGTEFEVDFAAFDAGSVGPEWRLVEIEAPMSRLLTKSGNPSAKLTHAMRQAQDWQAWVHDNGDYARKLLPYIEYPLVYIFMGRRSELASDAVRKRLRLLNVDNRRTLEIHTLDWFASMASSVLALIGGDGGTWSLPMKALTHSDLSNGLPPRAAEYLKRFFSWPVPKYPEDFLRERKWKYNGRGDEEFE
jgi:hypothetical protein